MGRAKARISAACRVALAAPAPCEDGVARCPRRKEPEATREHTFRGIAASIDRARQTLGYAPRFSSLEALYEALTWLVADGQVDVGGQRFQLST